MFFGKQPEQAEAMASVPLTQPRGLAPGPVLRGVPAGVAASSRSWAGGSPAATGCVSCWPGGHWYQTWQSLARAPLASGGKSARVSSACHLHVLCTAR